MVAKTSACTNDLHNRWLCVALSNSSGERLGGMKEPCPMSLSGTCLRLVEGFGGCSYLDDECEYEPDEWENDNDDEWEPNND